MPLRYLLPALLAALISGSSRAADALSIATFNCEFLLPAKVHMKFGLPFSLTGSDARIWAEPGYRDQHYRQAVEAVAGYLAALDADVLVLTEVGSRGEIGPLLEALAARGSPYPNVAACDSADTATGQHVAILSRRPMTTVLHRDRAVVPGFDTYDTELDGDESEQETGVEKGLHVRFEAGGNTVNLIGLHLKSERGGHESDAKRIAQASIVRRYYLPYLARGEHVIVAGDLNDDRGEPTLRRIRGRDDIGEDLLQTANPSFFGGRGPDRWAALGERWTYVYNGIREQIDHVLISHSLLEACGPGGIEVSFPAQSDELVSDHRPVLVRLALQGGERAGPAAEGAHAYLIAAAWQQTSVEYRMVTESIFRSAAARLESLAVDPAALADPDHPPSGPGRSRVAVLMDVDGTVLDGSPYVARLVWSGIEHAPELWDAWVDEEAAPAVPGAVEFIDAVRRLDERLGDVDLDLFLVTNRDASHEAATIANLRRLGVEIDPEFVLCAGEQATWDRSKSSRREHVAALGYRIAMLVGDDFNDMRPVGGLDRPAREDAYRDGRAYVDRGMWVVVPNAVWGSWITAATKGADPGLPLSRRLAEALDRKP